MPVKPVGAIVVLLLGLAGIGAALPTPATTTAPPMPLVDDLASSVSMTVSPVDLSIQNGDQDLQLTVTIDNRTSAPLDASVVDATVNHAALTSTNELADWLSAADDSISAPTSVLQVSTPSIAAGETRVLSMTVPSAALGFTEGGVFAVGARLTAGVEDLAEARTAVAWESTVPNPLELAIAAPLVTPSTTTALISSANLAAYTAPGGLLTEQLTAMIGTPVAIGIDPQILASIRVLGKSAPASALNWLSELESVANPTFPLAYADADLVLPLRAGSAGVLAPTSFDFAIDPSQFLPVSTATPSAATPSPTPTPGEPVSTTPPLPTTAQLTAFHYTLPALAWPADNSATSATVGAIKAAGYTTQILSSDNITRAAGTQGIAAKIGDTLFATSDETLSTLFQTAIAASTQADWNVAMAQLSATLALDSELSPGAGSSILATLGRSWPTSGYRVAQTLSAVSALPWTTPTTLPAALHAAPVTATIIDAPTDPARVTTVAAMLAATAADAQFATVAADPLAITAEERLRLLSVTSTSWLDDPAGWKTAAASFLSASKKLTGAVSIASSSTIQLLSAHGSLPVTVTNKLDQQVTVYITVQPHSPVLRVDNTLVELIVEPQSSRKAQIPVQSLSNGEVRLTVSLTDRLGHAVGQTAPVELNVHAGWETAGTVIFGALVVLIFGAGIYRTIRKRRRTAPDDADSTGGAGSTSPDPTNTTTPTTPTTAPAPTSDAKDANATSATSVASDGGTTA